MRGVRRYMAHSLQLGKGHATEGSTRLSHYLAKYIHNLLLCNHPSPLSKTTNKYSAGIFAHRPAMPRTRVGRLIEKRGKYRIDMRGTMYKLPVPKNSSGQCLVQLKF